MSIEDCAIEKIKDLCFSGDLECNGIKLDEILDTFLRDSGFAELADVAESVPCLRA